MASMHRLLLLFAAAASAFAVMENLPDAVSMLQVGTTTMRRVIGFGTNLESYGTHTLSQLRRSPPPLDIPAKQEMGSTALASMRAAPDDLRVQQAGCGSLAEAMSSGSWLSGYMNQEFFVSLDAHKVVLQAMKKFPNSLPLQMTCSQALNNMVHLNAPMAKIVGDAGAIEAMIACMHRFPDAVESMGSMFGIIGSFCDYDTENRNRVARLGGIDMAFNITRQHYSAASVLGLQCLASTQCWPAENHNQLKRNGYISTTAQHLRDFPNAVGIRGEGIFVLSMCFLGERDSDEAMVQSGMIEETVKGLRDAPHMQLDVLATTDRIYAYGNDVLAALAAERPEWRERAVKAGAVEQVTASVMDFLQGKAQANVAMKKFSLEHLDIVGKGCRALSALTTGSPQGIMRFSALRGNLKRALNSPNVTVAVPSKCRELLAA